MRSTRPLLAAALRSLRVEADTSQASLARSTGLAQSSISAYEVGDTSPNLDAVELILKALDRDWYSWADAVSRAGGDAPKEPAAKRIYVDEDRILAASRARLKEIEPLLQVAADRALDQLPDEDLEDLMAEALRRRVLKSRSSEP